MNEDELTGRDLQITQEYRDVLCAEADRYGDALEILEQQRAMRDLDPRRPRDVTLLPVRRFAVPPPPWFGELPHV